jgi:hypothetical protein
MSEKETTKGYFKTYQGTLVAGSVVISTSFQEIYDWFTPKAQQGSSLKGGEHLIDRFTVNGNQAVGTLIGDKGMPVIPADAGDITRIFANVASLGGDSLTSIGYTMQDDGTVFTDYTTQAREATDNDVQLLPAAPVAEDATYYGIENAKFKKITIGAGTAANIASLVLAWEYYNGSTWVDLATAHNLVDGSSGYSVVSGSEITFDIPSDWAKTTINSQSAYWIRSRVVSIGAVTTQPLAGSIDFGIALILDILVGGTSIWATNPENRPHFYDEDTDLFVEVLDALIDNGAFTKGALITASTIYIGLGTAPVDLEIQVWGSYDSIGGIEETFSVSVSGGDLTITSSNPESTTPIEIPVRGLH